MAPLKKGPFPIFPIQKWGKSIKIDVKNTPSAQKTIKNAIKMGPNFPVFLKIEFFQGSHP